jgi:hypothetical protein
MEWFQQLNYRMNDSQPICVYSRAELLLHLLHAVDPYDSHEFRELALKHFAVLFVCCVRFQALLLSIFFYVEIRAFILQEVEEVRLPKHTPSVNGAKWKVYRTIAQGAAESMN